MRNCKVQAPASATGRRPDKELPVINVLKEWTGCSRDGLFKEQRLLLSESRPSALHFRKTRGVDMRDRR
jgi:hypothetical protein